MPRNRDYPEILADLADQIGQKLVEKRVCDPERAADIGFEAAEHIRRHWGKQPVYIPAGEAYDLSKRDVEIFNRCNNNHAELAREYNLTVVRIYQIVKAVRAEMIRKRQGALF
jgi:Mor family transcriptional regulator